ncbi:MAG: hypothetical protein KGN02_08350 [bacterium]|nr:hypothetical protein [bacterium]
MSDSFRVTPPEQQWSGTNSSSNGYQGAFGSEPAREESDNEVGKALLVGLLGGLVSAAGYFIYRRLPDEQKERLHSQVRSAVAERINELRQNFNI